MKSIKLSIVTLISLGVSAHAGGDIYPVETVYEREDIELAQEAYVEPEEATVTEEVVQEEVLPEQVVVQEEIPMQVEVPKKEISPSGFYAGLGISGTSYQSACDCPTKSGTERAIALTGRVGYDFNPYIGLELRTIKSIAKDDGAEISHTGIFVKPMLPVGITNLYALLGVAKTKTDGTLQKVNAESVALGAGIEIDLSKDTPKDGRYSREFDGRGDQEKGIGIFVDYEKLIVKDNAPKLDAISAGVTYDF